MDRSTEEVAQAHLDAVEGGDPIAMAADYAGDAVLERGGERYVGRHAIADYFATVPDRLGGGHIVFDSLEVHGHAARFRWHIEGNPDTQASGFDICQIAGGAIVHQVVHLGGADF